MSTSSKSESAPAKAPVPDLSWFCCIVCSRRPMPHASFSMLLTTCSHIVCSSCWSGRGNGECPSCGMKANTLNLSTTKQLPKQLERYYKTPVDLAKRLLTICEFQEFQKRQTLERRKVAWVLINHQRAKEDFEKEYAECKELLTALNQKKRELILAAENLRRRGKDPVQMLRGKVPEEVIKVISGAPPTPGASAPSTPFFPTPLSRPPSTSTPAVAGAAPPTVEFVEPRKLPHTIRGSVTSKAVRRSPSNPQTPLLQPQFINTPASVLPAKRPRGDITPVLQMDVSRVGQHARYSGHPSLQTGQPVRQSYQSVKQMNYPRTNSGQLLMPAGRPGLQSTLQPAHPSLTQFSRPTMHSGQPRLQFGQPALNTSGPVLQPVQLPTVRPILPPRRPIQQSFPAQLTPRSSPQQQTAVAAVGGVSTGHGGSVRMRAVPSSSVSQRIFPPQHPSQPSQRTPPSQHPSQRHQQPVTTSGRPAGIEKAARISLRQIPSPHSMPQGPHSARGHVKTPNNPSPLLRAFTTTPHSSSPWQQQRGQGSHRSRSPWKPGHTPSPGMRMSVGSGASGGSGRGRLTPLKS